MTLVALTGDPLVLARADKYSPDEPRDSHGRFGSGDDAGERTIDLYHHTSPENARSITANGFRPGEDVFFSDKPHGYWGRAGSAAVHVRVPAGLAADAGVTNATTGVEHLYTVAADQIRPEHIQGVTQAGEGKRDKYSPDQPRDDHGRFGTGSGDSGAAAEAIGHASPEGFTVHPYRGSVPTTGYQVAMTGHTQQYPASIMGDRQALAGAVKSLLLGAKDTFTPGGRVYIGGWVHDGKLWLEPSERISDRDQATSLGRQRDQISVWDNSAGREIPTGGSGGIGKALADLLGT